ncbi:MAG: ATP-binding protein [Paracoccaceae bacterium]
MPKSLRDKWRPKLWQVVALVLGLVLCLPFAGLLLFQFYASQLVQQTEESLIGQASILAATYAELFQQHGTEDMDAFPLAPENLPNGYEGYAPIFPTLSLGKDTVLPPRPAAKPAEAVVLEFGPALSRISNAAQQQTLAGFRILDQNGTVIAGTAELGTSLKAIPEVAAALAGQPNSVARQRIRDTGTPLVYGLSEGTRLRVFVALPVVVKGRVIGAVYLNRTPNHIFRFLYGERFTILKAVAFILFATGLIGLIFWRFIARPLRALIAQTERIEQSGKAVWAPPKHYGTREIETLGQRFATMTTKLQRRQDAITTYTAHATHELKSPLTAVQGAAELLEEAGMSEAQWQRFLANIQADTARMESLLQSMRDYARAEQPQERGTCMLNEVLPSLISQFGSLRIEVYNAELLLPVHQETLAIVLKHLLENSAEHGAKTVTLTAGKSWLKISDDGSGISAGNRDKVLTPFFTTRRKSGGTGMGLSIVKSLLEGIGGDIEILDQKVGAGIHIFLNAEDM